MTDKPSWAERYQLDALVMDKDPARLGYYLCRHPNDVAEDCVFSVPEGVLMSGRRIERPLQVGDRVKFKDRSCAVWCGELRAIDEDRGWVRQISPKLGNCTVRLADLEPAPVSEGGGT